MAALEAINGKHRMEVGFRIHMIFIFPTFSSIDSDPCINWKEVVIRN